MDKNSWSSVLLLLLLLSHYISGQTVPENVTVTIWEGNVTVTWAHPQGNPLDRLYMVQLSDYDSSHLEWTVVAQCNCFKTPICNIGTTSNYSAPQVRVGICTSKSNFVWSRTKLIDVKMSQLLAPTFSLSSTSQSVQIKVHKKLELYEIFPFGLQYSAFLWAHGQENQTLTISDEDDDGEIEFQSLSTLHMYCVRVMVESRTTDARNLSSESCIQLPKDTTVIMCTALLVAVSIAVLLMFFAYFQRRPGKMPAALKPVVNRWRPMVIGLDKVETLTDKGWLLITNKTELKRQSDEEKDRRESMDSGVSMEQPHLSIPDATMEHSGDTADSGCGSLKGAEGSASVGAATDEHSGDTADSGCGSLKGAEGSASVGAATDEHSGDTEVDSGCGSLKGAEGSASVGVATEELLSLDERSRHDGTEGRDDSGFGLGPHEASGCLDKEGGLMFGSGLGGGYKSQSPASVDMLNECAEICEEDINLAAPSGGYRTGQVTCICADYEYCVFCKLKKPVDCQSGSQTQMYFSQSERDNGDGDSGFLNYLKKSLIQTVNVIGIEDDAQSVSPETDLMETEEFALLSACTLHLQCQDNQVFIPDTFTLDDVQLA